MPFVDMDDLLYAWAEVVVHEQQFHSFEPLRSTSVHDFLSAYIASNLS